jgi:hypothetical protein
MRSWYKRRAANFPASLQRARERARFTFSTLLDQCAMEEAFDGTTTVTAEQLAMLTAMPVPAQKKALGELIALALIEPRGPGWFVPFFARSQGDWNSAERQKLFRQKHKQVVTPGDTQSVTDPVTQNALPDNRDIKDTRDIELAALALSAQDQDGPYRFARWVYDAVLEAGVLPKHRASGPQDADRAVRADLKAAKTLLDAYGRAECEARARAMIEAIKCELVRQAPTCRTLSAVWDWDVVARIARSTRTDGKTGNKFADAILERDKK